MDEFHIRLGVGIADIHVGMGIDEHRPVPQGWHLYVPLQVVIPESDAQENFRCLPYADAGWERDGDGVESFRADRQLHALRRPRGRDLNGRATVESGSPEYQKDLTAGTPVWTMPVVGPYRTVNALGERPCPGTGTFRATRSETGQ
jgi:hypothetical protein